MLACACGLRTKAACQTSGTTTSSMKRACPRNSGSSSIRTMRDPISAAISRPSATNNVRWSFRDRLRGLFQNRLRGRVKLGHQFVEGFRAERIDVEIELLRLRQEFRIFHRLLER